MKIQEDTTGRCLECGDPITYGRSDRKFCSGRCKNRYNYRKGGRLKGLRRKTIGAINRNYEILESLIARGVTRIDIPDLGQLGYNFNCITSYHKVRNHNEYRCYDIKYCMSGSSVFKLERSLRPGLSSEDP